MSSSTQWVMYACGLYFFSKRSTQPFSLRRLRAIAVVVYVGLVEAVSVLISAFVLHFSPLILCIPVLIEVTRSLSLLDAVVRIQRSFSQMVNASAVRANKLASALTVTPEFSFIL